MPLIHNKIEGWFDDSLLLQSEQVWFDGDLAPLSAPGAPTMRSLLAFWMGGAASTAAAGGSAAFIPERMWPNAMTGLGSGLGAT